MSHPNPQTDYNASDSDVIDNLASDIDKLFNAVKTNPMAYISEKRAIWDAYQQLGSLWSILNATSSKHELKKDKS